MVPPIDFDLRGRILIPLGYNPFGIQATSRLRFQQAIQILNP